MARSWTVLSLLLAFTPVCVCAFAGEPPLAFENVKPLEVEELGVPLRTMRRSGDFLVPKPEGKGWWFITSYNPVRRNSLPIQVFIIDLDSHEVRRAEMQPSGALCRSINNRGILGQDGKFYIGHYARMGIWTFDPADGSLEYLDFPEIQDRVLPFCMWMAPNDGKIYLGTASAKAYLVEFDPKTRAFRNFGVQGPNHGAPRYVYYMAVGNKYIYSAAGKNPWYLVATHRETMEQKILFRDAEYIGVGGSGDNCTASIKVKPAPDKPAEQQRYSLRDGQAIPYQADPAAVKTPRAKRVPQPEMLLTLARPNSEGKAQVWWRMPGKEWEHVDLTGIQTTPWRFTCLRALPDGRLIGAPRAYEDFFIYDPKAAAFTIPGKSPLSCSFIECVGDKVFLLGYPGTYFFEYDPARPWTCFTTTPTKKEPPLTAPESNPRACMQLGKFTQTHHVRGSAVGADGFIYAGGHAERLHVGGGIVWWDPVNRKGGGLREPFLMQDCAGLAAADGGRLIVYSSFPVRDPKGQTPTPKEGKLFVFDTATREIVFETTPLPGMSNCGPIAAIGKRVFGVGRVGKGYVLYVFDIAKRETVHSRSVAERALELKTGPDCMIYAFLGKVLVRIDPKSFAVEAVGSVEKAGWIEFVGADAYLTGTPALRRIRNLAPGVP